MFLMLLLALNTNAKDKIHAQNSAKKIIQKNIAKLDSQFYAINNLLRAAKNPGLQQNYYMDTVLGWVLSTEIYYQYNAAGKITQVDYQYEPGKINNQYLYEYDAQGREIALTVRNRQNASGDLLNAAREEQTYDAQNRVVARLIKKWNAQSNVWEDDQRAMISYDSNNYLTEYRIDKLTFGIWITQFGYKVLPYYENNLLKEIKYLGYNPQKSNYDSTSKHVYLYNGSLLASTDYYSYDESLETFYRTERQELFYDANNRVNRMIEYVVDLNNNLVPNARVDSMEWHTWNGDYYSYDNIQKKYVYQIWSDFAGTYLNADKFERSLLDTNNSIVDYYEEWLGYWSIDEIHNIEFDNHKNIVLNEIRRNASGQLILENGLQYENTYDASNTLTQYIQKLYDTRISAYRETNKVVYSNFVGIDKQTNSMFKIYPNPSNGLINIESKNITGSIISIYDSQGKLVMQKNITKELDRIDLSSFEKGLYFIQIGDKTEKLLLD